MDSLLRQTRNVSKKKKIRGDVGRVSHEVLVP